MKFSLHHETLQVSFIILCFGKVIKIVNFLHACALKHYQLWDILKNLKQKMEIEFVIMQSKLHHGNSLKRYAQLFFVWLLFYIKPNNFFVKIETFMNKNTNYFLQLLQG